MFKLPVYKTAWARAVERLVVVGTAAAGADWLSYTSLGTGAKVGGIYWVVKTLVDLLNKNVPNY